MSITLDVVYMGLPDLLGAAVSALGLGVTSELGRSGLTWAMLEAVPLAALAAVIIRHRQTQ